jgi:cytochrome c biogenesis protein CcmG/thiol:disulfide interchange protein DsbE
MIRGSTTRAATLAAVVLLGGCAKTGSEGGAAFQPLSIGAPVPEYSAATLGGDTVRVGGKEEPTILNVWATWCVACQEEMAALDSLSREFKARGVRVIGVSVDEGETERVRRFAMTNHLGFTIAHDPAASIEQSYQVVGVPTTFVIGRDGKLLWKRTGNIVDVMGDVRGAVAGALAGK